MSKLNPETLKTLSGLAAEAIQLGDFAGVSGAVYHDGEIHFMESGKASLENDTPFNRETIARIASMTKPITSVAMMILIEEGKAKLHDPISKWMPEFSKMKVLKTPDSELSDTYDAPRQITIEDLLTHRSGLTYGFTTLGPLGKAYDDKLGNALNSTFAPDEWLARLASLPLIYPPGERFNYSHSTDVLGLLVGRIAGTSFRDFVKKRIFDPLGMNDTDFYVPIEKRDRAAEQYYLNEETGALEPSRLPHSDEPPALCFGGGGLWSTVADYLKFQQMLLNGGTLGDVRILKPETLALMSENRLTDKQREDPFLGLPYWVGSGFGLGFQVVLDPEKNFFGAGAAGTISWGGYFGTRQQVDPKDRAIIVWFVQDDPRATSETVTAPPSERRLRLLAYWIKLQHIFYGDIRNPG